MKSKIESKKTTIKNRTCCSFDNEMKVENIIRWKIIEKFFLIITFYTKKLWMQDHCVLGSIK